MTIRKSLLAALGTVAVAGMWTAQASQAAVPISVPRPVISIPKVTIPAVRPGIPAVRPAVSAVKPVIPAVRRAVSAVKPAMPAVRPAVSAPKAAKPSVHTAIASTHAAVLPATHAPASNVGVATTLDPNVAVPPHTGPAIATVLNGKPVIKLTNVNGNETTVYYLSADQKHVVAAISSISTVPPQNVATTQPVNQPAAQHGQPSSSGQIVTSTPVSYPEIKDAQGRPMGYVNAQGQNIYFTNGQMPPGFTVGPNNTIQTYVTTTSTPTPPSNPAPTPAPQQPSPSKLPAASSGHKVTSTPVSYPEIKDAYGRPMGYINSQGLAVYFPNGQMPPGFSVGPNNTIQTYIKSTT